MKARLLAVVCLAGAGLLPAQTVYSPVTGWHPTNNPSTNGPWSYGYKTSVTGSLTLFTQNKSVISSGVTLEFWHSPSGDEPGLGLNTNASLDWILGSNNLNPLEIHLHPSNSGQMAVLRFTAPSTGDFTIAGTFSGNDSGGTTTTGYLVHNTTTFLTQAVSGFNTTFGFSETRSLTAGDTVDVVVDWGSNTNFFNDSTGLYLTVTAIPEPSTYAAAAGLLALAAAAWARRKRTAG